MKIETLKMEVYQTICIVFTRKRLVTFKSNVIKYKLYSYIPEIHLATASIDASPWLYPALLALH